jgi:hypothetical protein
MNRAFPDTSGDYVRRIEQLTREWEAEHKPAAATAFGACCGLCSQGRAICPTPHICNPIAAHAADESDNTEPQDDAADAVFWTVVLVCCAVLGGCVWWALQ